MGLDIIYFKTSQSNAGFYFVLYNVKETAP